MKRLLCILFLFLPLLMTAKVVSREAAETAARRVFDSFARTRSSSGEIRLLWDGRTATRGLMNEPPFYVFGRKEGGFVVIAGEDCCRPVLAFSETNEFRTDGMPGPVAGWFESLSDLIMKAREQGLSPSPSATAEWTETRSHPVTVQLETAQWDQGEPYNWMAPVLPGATVHSPTGCTNTATAIVMRYHRWPPVGIGTLPDYTYSMGGKTRTQAGRALGQPYDWDGMPLTTPAFSEQQGWEVARLMYDCAIMNKAKFGLGNTTNSSENIPPALVTYMSYDASIRYVTRTDFSTDEWENLLRQELDAGRPIIYRGAETTNSAHAWVIDGYSSDGYFAMNWGWGGTSNGFFLISPMEETGNHFVLAHKAVIGIQPDRTWEPETPQPFVNRSWMTWDYRISYPITCRFMIRNASWVPASFILRPALCDRDGRLKQFIHEETTVSVKAVSSATFGFEGCLAAEVSEDDRIRLFFLDGNEWKPCPLTAGEGEYPMKSDRPIEACSTLSYDKALDLLTVSTEQGNQVRILCGNEIRILDGSEDHTFSSPVRSLPTRTFTVRIFNMSESKDIRIIR